MVVTFLADDDAARARHWATQLRLVCVGPGETTDADVSLTLDHGVLTLRDNRGGRLKPLCVDFSRSAPASKKQLLGRAVGRRTRTVVDATAGWGEDTRRLCAMGYRVTAIERNPVMAALLSDAAGRAGHSQRSGVPAIIAADAIGYLADHPDSCDCVYLDPMFPPRRRASTLPKRSLRLLRELVGDDPDRDELFAAAGLAAVKRIVVKRPDHGQPVFGQPGEVVTGKLVRYDVYHLA